jgi:uncharacterized protein (DUF4415 family)
MKKKMVSYTRETLPPMTESRLGRLKAMAARPDSAIDTSDIPVMSDEEWAKAAKYKGRFYRPVKQQVTARLDADVLAWLKKEGKGYQSRMNEILRREMLVSCKASPDKVTMSKSANR